jgi:hypothetical protein
MIFLPFLILPLQKKTYLLCPASLMKGVMTFLLYLDFLMIVVVAYRPFRASPGKTVAKGCLLYRDLIPPMAAYLLFPHSLSEISKI